MIFSRNQGFPKGMTQAEKAAYCSSVNDSHHAFGQEADLMLTVDSVNPNPLDVFHYKLQASFDLENL